VRCGSLGARANAGPYWLVAMIVGMPECRARARPWVARSTAVSGSTQVSALALPARLSASVATCPAA
jgi:hypothetical protein